MTGKSKISIAKRRNYNGWGKGKELQKQLFDSKWSLRQWKNDEEGKQHNDNQREIKSKNL